jgi:hypothetical protein
MSSFSAPSEAGTGWSAKESLGHLCIFDVESYEQGIVTSLGEKDAIRATIHDIDAGETFTDSLVFPKVLIASLKGRVGAKVLARVAQGVAKPGQSAPWTLDDASGDPAAVKAAEDYLSKVAAGNYTAPADAAPAPAGVDKVDADAIAAAKALLAAQVV